MRNRACRLRGVGPYTLGWFGGCGGLTTGSPRRNSTAATVQWGPVCQTPRIPCLRRYSWESWPLLLRCGSSAYRKVPWECLCGRPSSRSSWPRCPSTSWWHRSLGLQGFPVPESVFRRTAWLSQWGSSWRTWTVHGVSQCPKLGPTVARSRGSYRWGSWRGVSWRCARPPETRSTVIFWFSSRLSGPSWTVSISLLLRGYSRWWCTWVTPIKYLKKLSDFLISWTWEFTK